MLMKILLFMKLQIYLFFPITAKNKDIFKKGKQSIYGHILPTRV